MFRVESDSNGHTSYVNDGFRYLHSDGGITRVAEYFETPDDAQKVLDKFYPKPKHEWKHGDVFLTEGSNTMIYMSPEYYKRVRKPQVFYINGDLENNIAAESPVKGYLKGVTFLFNIK